MNDAAIREPVNMPSAIEAAELAAERRERLVAAVVRGAVLLWCLPFLAVGYVLTWSVIVLWRTILLGEALVHGIAGSAPAALPVEFPCDRLALPHTGSLDLLVGRRGPR